MKKWKNVIPGLMEAIWDEAGVSCEVLVGGTIEVGDEVKVLSSQGGTR
jgi:MOSC domain-containing protein YiiM